MPTKISLCLIAKNEEDVLEKSLASISPIVDEFVLVDTGSEDSTLQIMKKFSQNIHNFRWVNDFSAARNFACQKATNVMILAWDADWYIQKASLDVLGSILKKQFDLLKVNLVLDYENSGQFLIPKRVLSYPLIYNKHLYQWKYPIHNQLLTQSKQPKIIFEPEIQIFHLRPPDSKPWRFKQTTEILKAEIHKPEATEEEVYRSKFFLARNFYHSNRLKEATELYQEVLNNSKPNPKTRIHLLENLSFCFLKQKKYKDLDKLISENNIDFVSDPRLILILADLNLLRGFFAEAKVLYRKFLEFNFLPNATDLEYDFYRYQSYPKNMLGKL